MTSTNPPVSARLKSCILYNLSLTGESKAPGWTMLAHRARLVRAIDGVRAWTAAKILTLGICELGLSVRFGAARADVVARGFWASPLVADGGRLRRALAASSDKEVHLEFVHGRLWADGRSVKAREL